MPRAGLYLGILVGLLLAFGAYKIGVRKGGMGGTVLGMQKNNQMASVPPLKPRTDGTSNGTSERDQGKLNREGSKVFGDIQRISEDSPDASSKAGSGKAGSGVVPGAQANTPGGPKAGNGAALSEKSLQVLRLLSNPDNEDSRRKIRAMRDWLRNKLASQSSAEFRSLRVYFWLSKSSRRGGADMACLEVTLPKGWTQAQLMRELATFGQVNANGFGYDFGAVRNNSMARKRLPSEIRASLAQE